MQADSMSRFFAMTITDNGAPWTAPDGAAYTVRFGAPGMPAGWYDTITEPGGGTHPAVVVDENTVTVEIAEQAVSAPGLNILCVLVTDAQGYQIASWPFLLNVQAVPGFDAPEATVYYNALTAQVAQVLASQTAAAGSASAAANSAAAAANSAQEAASAVTGVVSFNGRQGVVMPQAGDYTAEMVGALAENGTAASADKLASQVNIGNAPFDGSESITLLQIGAAPSERLSQTVSAQNYASGGIVLTQIAGTTVCRFVGVTVNQTLPVGSEYTLGAIVPEEYRPAENLYETIISASTGTRFNAAVKPDGRVTIQPLDANGASGDAFYGAIVWQ